MWGPGKLLLFNLRTCMKKKYTLIVVNKGPNIQRINGIILWHNMPTFQESCCPCTRCKNIIWHKNIIMWPFMCNVYVLISWRFGHNMKPFLVYFASNIQPTLVRYIVLVGFQLRNNKQRVKMFTRIWTWLIKCSNPIKPEGLFRKFDHAHIQTKFISWWTF